MTILSIQSSVAYGHVGNSAAVFPLQRLGHEVWPVNTVNFSNHPGFGSYKGGVFHASDVREVIEEIDARGAFRRCEAVLSGYLGEAATGPVVLNAVDRVRSVKPNALYVLDPVIGDAEKGVYVADGIAEFFRDKAVGAADIVLPNAFELAQLTGMNIEDVDGAAAAAALLVQKGPEMVVVTGLRHEGEISVLLVMGGQAWQVTTPLIDAPAHGAGDAFAALFLGHYLRDRDPKAALEKSVGSIYGILAATAHLGLDSMALIDAQREIVNPTEPIAALPLWAV